MKHRDYYKRICVDCGKWWNTSIIEWLNVEHYLCPL